ncbi:MAG TPA: hypothetical protein VFU47_11600, partial [Armatimonadota bacterium]|nr:hypothetical protein [Armatimonadota bacterium]
SSTFKEQVKDLKDNGDVVTEASEEGTKLTVMGMEQDQPAVPPVTVTRTRLGRFVDLKQEGEAPSALSPAVQRLFLMVQDPILPDKAVASGAAWPTELDNPAVQGKKVSVQTTYLGTEKVGDAELWKIKQTFTADTGMGEPLSEEATYWLSPATGELVRKESTVKNVPTQFGVMSWTEVRERVKS